MYKKFESYEKLLKALRIIKILRILIWLALIICLVCISWFSFVGPVKNCIPFIIAVVYELYVNEKIEKAYKYILAEKRTY